MHSELPTIDLYFPALHVTHVPPSGPANPALHLQLVSVVLTLGAWEFEGQVSHFVLPIPEY